MHYLSLLRIQSTFDEFTTKKKSTFDVDCPKALNSVVWQDQFFLLETFVMAFG